MKVIKYYLSDKTGIFIMFTKRIHEQKEGEES